MGRDLNGQPPSFLATGAASPTLLIVDMNSPNMFQIVISLDPCISDYGRVSEHDCLPDCPAESAITVYRKESRIRAIGSNSFEFLKAKI